MASTPERPASGALAAPACRLRALTVALTAGLAATLGAADGAAAPVRLMLLWTHQSQFAGCYLAVEKGFYAARGLEVEIVRGGADRDPVRSLVEGEADFAILWLSSALAAADRGVPLAHVTQVFNASHLAVAGWKENGVHAVRDLHGRRVSVWGEPFRPAFTAFFKSQGIEPVMVPQYSSVNLFLHQGVDACSIMHYNESHVLYQAGVDDAELSVFALRDHGINFPEDGIYTLRKTRADRPEASRAMAAATLEGWRYAAEHPDEAVEVVLRHVRAANLPTNRTHMRWMLRAVLPSIFPADGKAWQPGVLDRKAYEETAKWLLELGQVKRAPAYEEFTR